MNTYLPLLISRIGIGLVLLIGSLSCQKKDDTAATPKTIPDLLLEDKQFSLLRTALNHGEAGDVLKGANLTVFAPNDSAFQASGLGTDAAITALPKTQVKNMLLYHVLNGPVSSTAVPAGVSSVQTANQGVAYVNRSSNGTIYVNNARITRADIPAANGIIHVVNRVLTPSMGSVLAVVQNTANLTMLAAALKRISSVNPTLLARLNNTTSANAVTLLAPNDQAFKTAGYASVAAIEAANAQNLSTLLSYHIVSGVSLSQQFQTGSVGTLNGNRLAITANNGIVTVKGTKNTTPAVVRTPDLVANNGIVHIVDQVLQP